MFNKDITLDLNLFLFKYHGNCCNFKVCIFMVVVFIYCLPPQMAIH